MRLRYATYAVPLIFLTLFLIYPLAMILRLGFAGGFPALTDRSILSVIWFTCWQAALSTGLTLLAGLPAAYVLARYRFPGRSALYALATAPFVLPVVVVAAGFVALLGRNGIVNDALVGIFGAAAPQIDVLNTLGVVLLAHVFYNLSVVVRLVGGLWSVLDPRLEEAAAVLGASRRATLRRVTLPLLAPAIGAAALLVFLFTFGSFGVVLLLGGPRLATIEVEIYRQTAQALRLDVASTLALVQLCATLAAAAVYDRLQRRSAVALRLRPAETNARPPETFRSWLLVGGCVALVLLLMAPLPALALRSLTSLAPGVEGMTLEYYRMLGENRRGSLFFVPPLAALANSLLFAGAATLLALLVGIPAAYALAGDAMRGVAITHTWRRVSGRQIARAILGGIIILPVGVSAIVLGLGYIVAFGPPGWLRSPLLIPVAHALLALPLVVRSLTPALRAIDPRIREAARVLGAGPARIMLRVDLPLVAPALLVAGLFAFTVSLGDFGAALLLARPEYPTIPVVIARLLGQPGAANYGQALALGTILMGVTLTAFLVIERVQPRSVRNP